MGTIHEAAYKGDASAVRTLLEQHPDLVNVRHADGGTPLHLAVIAAHAPVVEMLLDMGADVNAGDSRNGLTPLHCAGDKRIAEILLAHGADVDARTLVGETPLFYAAGQGHREVADLLRTKVADIGIADAVAIGDAARVKRLLAGDPELTNRRLGNGRTLLHVAALTPNRDMMDLLLENGAYLEAMDEQLWTPLYYTIGKDSTDTAAYLLDRGASPHARDHNGQTPLHIAAATGDTDVASLLLLRGADVNAKDKWGSTPLGIAETQRNTELASIIRRHGGAGGTGCCAVLAAAYLAVASTMFGSWLLLR